MKSKVLSKKEQIEIIIDRIRKLDRIIKELIEIFDTGIDVFDFIYDIGYDVIPAILEIPDDWENAESEVEQLRDKLWAVMNNEMSEKDFFDIIKDYFKEKK